MFHCFYSTLDLAPDKHFLILPLSAYFHCIISGLFKAMRIKHHTWQLNIYKQKHFKYIWVFSRDIMTHWSGRYHLQEIIKISSRDVIWGGWITVCGPFYASRFVCLYRSVLFWLHVWVPLSLIRTTHYWNSLPGNAPLTVHLTSGWLRGNRCR